jgi:hypothetical protein
LISETRRRLKEWGKWAAGGEPSMSSMFKAMFGRGAQDLREMPEHIQEVDHIVCISPGDVRVILIKFYSSGGTYAEKAISLGIETRDFKRRIDRADYYVHSLLDGIPKKAQISSRMRFSTATRG